MTVASNDLRVLITGAAGRLGRRVAARFHAAGADVLATDIVAVDDVPYEFRRADLLDHESARSALHGVDALVHLGNHPGLGPGPPQPVFNENVAMNANVFQAAAEAGVGRVVFASTLQLIGSHVDTRTVVDTPPTPAYPLDGDTPATPANLYALSKTVSEVMLRYYAERCGMDCVALRLPLLYDDRERVLVETGNERADDVVEGFTGLTYDDAAELCLTVIRSAVEGWRVFMLGTSDRHRELVGPELLDRFYRGVDPRTPNLVDLSAITAVTGWRPSRHDDAPEVGPADRRSDGEPAP